MTLVGRSAEVRRIGDLIGAARSGRGGALMLRGEAGIGKSTLLDQARHVASGCRLVEAAGSEFETDLPFAALHQLCRPLISHLDAVPGPQRRALEVAFGLASGAPDPFLAGAATLTLLGAAARERPVVCLVDDAHWLDAATTRALAFVGRRLGDDPVALVVAARASELAGHLDDLPVVPVGGLTEDESRMLLATPGSVVLDAQVRDHIVAEARGNPLALRELPRAGGFGPPDTGPVPSRVERGYRQRLTGLSEDAVMLLTVASADPTGDPALLWPAARRLGLDVPAAAAAATATGLVDFATRVRFGHPLARSAVYRAADPDRRRSAHAALAAVLDPATDRDRRAWHRAQASAGPDDEVAAELAVSAATARSRGGVHAAAAFLERSAALTSDPGVRRERVLDAAGTALDAGRADAAAELLATLGTAVLSAEQHARADLLLGRIEFLRHGGRAGTAHMLRAAFRLFAVDPGQGRERLLDVVELSIATGRLGGVLTAIFDRLPATGPGPGGPDVLDALLTLNHAGNRAAVPVIRRVVTRADRPALAIMLAGELWDPETQGAIAASALTAGRESGEPVLLRLGLAQTASHAVLTGDLAVAITAIAEEEAVAEATGGPSVVYPRVHLAAMRGRPDDAGGLLDAPGQMAANPHWMTALLNNGRADYPAALRSARRATAHDDLFLSGIVLPELVEAAVRCGETKEAAAALDALTEHTAGSATPTGLGICASARGLVTGREDDYRESVTLLDKSPMVPYRARAHLLYGEWLRRAGRRRDARRELRIAHTLLAERGIEAFARRAAGELAATGENPVRRTDRPHDRLTARELFIARQVAGGATSPEVATQLFLSPRTVDAHLRNIYRKLGVSSRRQLRGLPGIDPRAT
ncbi:AAA family ATPase [Actinoplanes sp. TRM 88003]|uniref:AAA family ATPase n=1 Tax=Paractinoplanes aksuensis TaxID=2939490 RepID=A0ABT1DSS6_9ACTN|nr:LuxR family transcriptional regulator [Actinoplanes aksuensis]MCO8273893.1 AAA family ATPase [Actinoplanes aksuensis]